MDDTLLYVLFSYVGSSRESPVRRPQSTTESHAVYAVSMVASLNAREDLRNHMAEVTDITTIPSIPSLRGDANIAVMEMQNSRNRAVRM